MKRLILVFGVMGLVSCFLPMYYNYEGPEVWSWWQLRHDMPVEVYGVIVAYAIATWVGLTCRRRWHALAAALGFGVVVYALWPPQQPFMLIGWWLMQLSAFAGCATSLAVVLAGVTNVSEPV